MVLWVTQQFFYKKFFPLGIKSGDQFFVFYKLLVVLLCLIHKFQRRFCSHFLKALFRLLPRYRPDDFLPFLIQRFKLMFARQMNHIFRYDRYGLELIRKRVIFTWLHNSKVFIEKFCSSVRFTLRAFSVRARRLICQSRQLEHVVLSIIIVTSDHVNEFNPRTRLHSSWRGKDFGTIVLHYRWITARLRRISSWLTLYE